MTTARRSLSLGLPWLALLAAGPTALHTAAAEPCPVVDAVQPAADGFVELFDGRSLAGWEGAPGWWEVRDGVLVAESTPAKPCLQSHYLFWTGGEPGDFELRVTYRISGAANSGVQFRSERRPNWDVWGYQADCDTAGEYTGCLYQHDRGLVAQRGEAVQFDAAGVRRAETFGDPRELLKAVRAGGWNEYRIVAIGPRITLWINDVEMCRVEDHQPPFARPSGVIALQMHQGPPMKAELKRIRLRTLDAPPAEAPGP